MKNKPMISGLIAVGSPIPLLFLTMLWYCIWVFPIGMGLFRYDSIPDWIMVVSLLPLCISPLLGVFGIVHGIIKIKEKLSWLGITLSMICLIENFILIYGIGYIGSRF